MSVGMSEIPQQEVTAKKPTAGEAAKGMLGRALDLYFSKHKVESKRLHKVGKEEVKPKLESLQKARKSYEEITARGSKADATAQEGSRVQLANVAKELVPVSQEASVTLTPEEQQYVDTVVIATADRVAATMPLTTGGKENPWRFGSNLERGERYEAQKPQVFVRRNPDGLSVIVTTGNGQMKTDGQLAFNTPMPFEFTGEEAEQAKAKAEAQEKARVSVREYNFVKGEPGTAAAARIQKLTYLDENGLMQTSMVPATDSDGFSSVQRQVDRANAGVTSLYEQSGVLKVSGVDQAVRVVSAAPIDTDTVKSDAQRYLDNGNNPVDINGQPTVVLVKGSDELKQRLYPTNPNGIHIEGVVNPSQLNVEPARVIAQRTMESATKVRDLQEEMASRAFVSLKDMEARITDPAVVIAAVSGISYEDAQAKTDKIRREQETALRGMTGVDARESAFNSIYNALVGSINPTGAPMERNQQNALWAAAESLAKAINPEYIPTESSLEQRAVEISKSKEGSPQQKRADIAYLINQTALSGVAKDLLVQRYSETAAGMPMEAWVTALADMVKNGNTTLDALQLDPEMKGSVEAAINGEVLPQLSPEAALTRLFGEKMRENEDPAAFKLRVADLAKRMGITTGKDVLVEAVMHAAGADAPARREAYRQLLKRVNSGEVEFNADTVKRLQEGISYSPNEWSAFNAVLDTVGETALAIESNEELSDRLRTMGVEDADRRDLLVGIIREMTKGVKNQQDAEKMLENASLTPETANQLAPEQYLRYLDLTNATQEEMIGAVVKFMDAEPADLGPLRELSRRYPGLGRVIDDRLKSTFMDQKPLRDGESAAERIARLTALAGEYASYSPNSSTVREALLREVPEAATVQDMLGIAAGIEDPALAAALVGLLNQKFSLNRPNQGRPR